ncbi:hypothetical protein QQ045_011492 [Rhodiola kirilowii]
MNYNYVLSYLRLYRAALTDDWKTAETIFNEDPDADTAVITYRNRRQTALHIAVGTNSSHGFVEKLVNRIAVKDKSKLRTPDYKGNTSLHYAAQAGNTNAAKALLEKDRELALIANNYRNTAVKLAALFGQRETLEYLLDVTPDEIGEDGMSPYSGLAGGDLISLTITAGFYDVAMTLINKYPKLVTEENRDGITALQTLATQPSAFPSGRSRWWFWENIIYFCTPLTDDVVVNLKSEKKPASKLWWKLSTPPACGNGFLFTAWFKYVSFGLYIRIWRVAQYLVPLLKNIHDTKLKYKQTDKLMKVMITAILHVGEHSVAFNVLGAALSAATKHGIHELIEECLSRYPGLIWHHVEGLPLFMAAIKYRHVKVFNLVHQVTGYVHFVTKKFGKDNALHLVGRKASPHRLSTVTGAALQMQRELQWYQEVEKFVEPSFREALNKENKTPRMVFIDEHKDLVEKGEKWMKDTASSSTLVAALIVTVSFAAIFTAPGGNKDNGIAYFLRDSTFILFVISDAVALFSSVTSVLMFLAMLTSRYAVDDFLYALPKRITIGLVSLFISIASIMVTFCAAIALVLREQFAWIAIPVGLIACVPVTFFALLQLPLLVELVGSTYGPSIFRKQNNQILH